MFTLYPLKLKFILYNRIGKKGGERMAVLEIGNSEYKKFPAILQQPFASTHIMLKNYIKYLLKMQEFLSNSGQKLRIEISVILNSIFVQNKQI